MVRVLALAALGLALGVVPGPLVPGVGSGVAHAGTCPPAVALTGDADAVRAVRAQLDARGIVDENPGCPVVRARIERRGALLVVGITPGAPRDAAPGPAVGTIERAVGEPATAASVIESWARSDLAAPLLETRAVPVIDATPAVVVAPASPPAQGIQLFLAEETSLASDHTVWEGMQLGACVMLGPICAAARVHGGKVIAKPAGWDRIARKGAEAYVGIDIPVTVGRIRLTPGFAAGYGTMLTHDIGDDEKTGIEISGPRAEAHLALAIPLTPHIAIDLATTAELTQATGTEIHGSTPAGDPTLLYPEAPRALFRFAIGVRYGAL
ncbi:MAG TPA: hypothetical protein VHW23_30100 [Kofleriaceae bacterium]|nr:hypothetical protein [Kofleriaceae bacterium]